MRLLRRLLIAAGIIVILVAAFMLCVWQTADSMFRPRRSVDIAKVAKVTGVRFPRNAQLLDSCFVGGQGIELRAKLTIDRADESEFVGSVIRPRRVSRSDRLRMSDSASGCEHLSWWDPDSARKFTAISADVPASADPQPAKLRILVREDDPARCTVYLFFEGT